MCFHHLHASGCANPVTNASFVGAKIALFHGDMILTYLRDDIPSIPWPARWDLPGGGVEGDETPLECVLRELFEEFAITLSPDRIAWSRTYPSWTNPGLLTAYYAATVHSEDIEAIVFGDEGQYWRLMPVEEFLSHPEGIPHQQQSVRDYLASLDQ